ncbi:MAG: hypothetical protein HYZ27_03180 [Deltaproteobacteria bacterium]|nr:hypothetical protein [Deltaproteobacteria bacterium]
MRLARPTLVLLALAVSLLAGAALFKVWVYHDVVEQGYALSHEEKRRSELERRVEALEVEHAAERSPERLVRLAHERGFGPPKPGAVLGVTHGRP